MPNISRCSNLRFPRQTADVCSCHTELVLGAHHGGEHNGDLKLLIGVLIVLTFE
jgi:hypothetical protein